MPGLDLTQVSSNWKKLQAQLKSTASNREDATGSGAKRKRNASDTAATPSKKSRQVRALKPSRPRGKMGDLKIEEKSDMAVKNRQTLQQDFDIAAADISMAYGSFHELSMRDEVNIGRHPKHKAGKYLALDCEMVGTGPPPHADDVLARVSLVNFHGEQIYDTYVMPPPGTKVQDYRTYVSGIQRHHLVEGSARPFQQVQEEVAAMLKGNILVGHALRKDIQALQLNHPLRDIRDTSRYALYRVESKGKTPALRLLAKSQLGLSIQQGEHSSIEDARAAMMLYRREKNGFEAENRKTFGTRRALELKPHKPVEQVEESVQDEEEDDESVLDGEEDDLDQTAPRTQPVPIHKKKKKKKRTKR